MTNIGYCPKCHSKNIVCVPDNPGRHASRNNIGTYPLGTKIPSYHNMAKEAGRSPETVRKAIRELHNFAHCCLGFSVTFAYASLTKNTSRKHLLNNYDYSYNQTRKVCCCTASYRALWIIIFF